MKEELLENFNDKIAIYIAATNNINGNPRRGWMIVNTMTGDTEDFVDEGYAGIGSLQKKYGNIVCSGRIPVPASFYKEMLKGF